MLSAKNLTFNVKVNMVLIFLVKDAISFNGRKPWVMITEQAKTGTVVIVFLFLISVLIHLHHDRKVEKLHKPQKSAFCGI